MSLFQDRHDAGQQLADKLTQYAEQKDVVVLALPRGGIVVAYDICKELKLSLDIIVVRKLGVPGQEELAFGSIASGGVKVFNEDIVNSLQLSKEVIEQTITTQQQELERREKTYRGDKEMLAVKGKTVIIVDDGLATGATMRSAIEALKQRKPKKIIVAVPVAAYSTAQSIGALVEECICLSTPYPFYGIGEWFSDFAQTTDAEVISLLKDTQDPGLNN